MIKHLLKLSISLSFLFSCVCTQAANVTITQDSMSFTYYLNNARSEAQLISCGYPSKNGAKTAKDINLSKGITYQGKTYDLTEIQSEAFKKNTKVKSISLPSSLKVIGSYSFDQCSIESIYLQEGLDSIGEYAFKNSKLKKIELPTSTRVIANGAFSGCTLGTFIVPENVEVFAGGVECECLIFKTNKLTTFDCSGAQSIEFPTEMPQNYNLTVSGLKKGIILPSGCYELTCNAGSLDLLQVRERIGILQCRNYGTRGHVKTINIEAKNYILDGLEIDTFVLKKGMAIADIAKYSATIHTLIVCSDVNTISASTGTFPGSMVGNSYLKIEEVYCLAPNPPIFPIDEVPNYQLSYAYWLFKPKDTPVYVVDKTAYDKYKEATSWKDCTMLDYGIPDEIMKYDQKSGIPIIPADNNSSVNSPWYDLNGRKVNALEQNKTYIHNRKKVRLVE